MQENLKPIPRIAWLREKAGLTQLELSRRIGVTENTIQNWEKGRAGVEQIERIIKLCLTLDCKLEDLIEYLPSTELAQTQAPTQPKAKGDLSTIRRRIKTDKPAQTTQIKSVNASMSSNSLQNPPSRN